MNLYSIALFLHVVGALLLFTTLSLEGIGLRLIRRAATVQQAKDSTGIAGLNRAIGPASALGILVPGLYMTATTWGWIPWILVGFAGWLVIGVLGAVNGIRLAAIGRAAAAAGDRLPPDVASRLRDPMLLSSWLVRTAVVLGVVFLMTVKPGITGTLFTMAAAVALGAAASLPAWRAPASVVATEQ